MLYRRTLVPRLLTKDNGQHVSDHKTHFKWLAGVEFVEVIPKNPSGKLLRRVLREEAKAMLTSGKLSIIAKAKL